jgi:transcription termination factor Rho
LCEAVLKGKLLKVTDTSSKLLPELRQMATELGIPDAATMRKSELVEAIDQRGNGGNKSMTTNSDIPEDDVIEEFREESDTRVERDDRNSDDRGTYNREDRGSYNRNDRGNDDRGGYRRNDRNDRNGRNDRNDRNGDSGSRSRFRERGSRRERDDFEIKEDDVLLPVAGIIDLLENYAFVRTSGYLPGPNDVYVSMGLVRKFGLRKGDAVTGSIRQPKEGEQRQKFNPLVRVETINGLATEESAKRLDFSKLTPLYPQERLRLETDGTNLTTRVIDLVAPIGKGQRGLIVSPPKAGKTMVLQAIANAITTNNPEVHLMVVLVDERPEEVTDMQRSVKGEVIASTFDRACRRSHNCG